MALAIFLLGLTLPAVGEDLRPRSEVPPAFAERMNNWRGETDTSWYGWQPLLADAAAASVFVIGLYTSRIESGVAYTGLGLWTVCAPVIHAVHRRPGVGFGSLAMRVGFPVLGVVIGANATKVNATGECCGDLSKAVAGFFIGMGLASGLDAFMLSYETPSLEERSPLSTLQLAPTVTREGAALGLAMRF